MTWKIAVVALLALGACGATGSGDDTTTVMMDTETAAIMGAAPVPKRRGKESGCGAKTFSHLMGQPESAVQTISFDQPARITQLGDLASSDVNPERVTFTTDKLGNVVSIKCG